MRTSADVAPPAPPWAIGDELLRDLAVKINPHVALGSTHAANLAPTGCLADVVTKHGWDEALDKYRETRACLRRLRNTLEGAAGANGAWPHDPGVARARSGFASDAVVVGVEAVRVRVTDGEAPRGDVATVEIGLTHGNANRRVRRIA